MRAGLAAGHALDREGARTLARELRRARGLGEATRALRRRDLSRQVLDGRLRRAGLSPVARRETLTTLDRVGLVDDARFALGRAAALAERGYGDAAIRWRLERDGVDAETVAAAVGRLEPERDRAGRLVATRGAGPATARFLARRGFGDDVVEAATGAGDAPPVAYEP